jgi:hypothetical protein
MPMQEKKVGGRSLSPIARAKEHSKYMPTGTGVASWRNRECVITFKSLSPFSSIHPLSSTLNAKAVTLAVLPVALVVASTEIK